VKLRVVVAYALLLSFFVVLTPRELWHECDHHHDIENSNEIHFENGDCFACDFGLGFIDQPHYFFFSFTKILFDNNLVFSVSNYFKSEFHLFSHRGPPVL
jgi:hypothetical protein